MTDVGRVSLVLDAIAESRGPLTITDLAHRTQLPRSTVHRLVQALELQLYVIRPPDQPGYLLGPGLLKFGIGAHLRLLAANRNQLVAVAREVNENVELAIFSGREVVVVDQIASPERLKGVTKVGKSFSLHASSIGMALLAQLTDDRILELLPDTLQRFTGRTITEHQQLYTEIERVRTTHIAVDVEQHDVGICAVATGIVGPTGAYQAIAVVMPTKRFQQKASLAVASLRLVNDRIEPALVSKEHRLG
jgi:IclR family acetate operon transcriptional repressor